MFGSARAEHGDHGQGQEHEGEACSMTLITVMMLQSISPAK